MKNTGEQAAHLKAEVLAHRGDRKTKKTKVKLTGFSNEQGHHILKYGKTFSLLHETWLPAKFWKTKRPSAQLSPTDMFASDEEYAQALMWSMYELVEEEDHSLLASDSKFQRRVSI